MYAIDLRRPRDERRAPKPAESRDVGQFILDTLTYVGIGSMAGAAIGFSAGLIHGFIDWIRDKKGRAYERIQTARMELAEAEAELAALEEAEQVAEQNRHLDDQKSDSGWF